VLGGAVAAFPATSTTLAVSIAAQGKRNDAANVAFGLINSLPCFLAFALMVMAAAPRLGLWSFPAATAAALAVAALTWYRMNSRTKRNQARHSRGVAASRWPETAQAGPQAVTQHQVSHVTEPEERRAAALVSGRLAESRLQIRLRNRC
jgi:hypothetical protein